MNHDGTANDDLEGLLRTLDEADIALRALYRHLADDPDRATEYEPKLRDVHSRRIELAQRVGLVVLARRRASAGTLDAAPEPVPREPSIAGAANGNAPLLDVKDREPVSEESSPPSQPASDAQLAQWKSTVRSSGLGVRMSDAPSERTAWPLVLHELMSVVGPPRDLKTSVAVIEEVDALDGVSTDDRQARWVRLPKNVQQLWLSMLVARGRGLKELPSASESWMRVKGILSRFPPWAKTHVPGHVNGMQVKHGPMRGSWTLDARDYWSALDDLLGEERTVRPPPWPTRKPRRPSNDDDDGPEIDPAWRLLPLVRGREAIIVGGDPREPNRERIERAFQFASLEWPSIDGPRKVASVVERISRGTYRLVLVLQPFVAHTESEPIIAAAKATGISWALAEGYGISAVKLALERFLGGSRCDVPPPAVDDEAVHRP